MSAFGVAAVIAGLHLLGWGMLVAAVASGHATGERSAFGIGVGVTAYMLGVRHAFDADHIAAIDNTTRRLVQHSERPVSVGFWFSCGHSTIVFALTLLLACGAEVLAGPVGDAHSDLHALARLFGTVVSSGFLYGIAALNIIALANTCRVIRQIRAGRCDEAALERQLHSRGLLNRLVHRIAGIVATPRQMYAVGLLFGLGFDTATEIGLLVLATSGAASGLPWYAVLSLPLLFAAGMSLFDTLQGSLMTAAYGWALTHPVRRIYYNLVVTGLSVAAALVIGTTEIVALLSDRLQLQGALWTWMATLDLNTVGFAIAGLLGATWLLAVALAKYGRADEPAGGD